MCTCQDGKGGELSSRASKMLYKPPEAVYIGHIRNGSTNQIAGNSMFSSEIILNRDMEVRYWLVPGNVENN